MRKKTSLSLSVGLAVGIASSAAGADGFSVVDALSIDKGGIVLGDATCTHDTVTLGGSCFSTALLPSSLGASYFLMGAGSFGFTFIEGFDGIKLGVGQPAGSGTHPGLCTTSDTGAITSPWNFFDNCGHEFSTGSGIGISAATSDPNSVSASGNQTLGLPHPAVDGHHFLDFSNWRVSWSGIPSINMGGGLQDCGTTTDATCDADGTNTIFSIGGTFFNGSSLAHVECFTDSAHTTPAVSCSATAFYVAEYAAVVPQADPSNFGGVLYEVSLTGQISAVPVPAAAWLFGSGMLGLVGVARRRKAIKKA